MNNNNNIYNNIYKIKILTLVFIYKISKKLNQVLNFYYVFF